MYKDMSDIEEARPRLCRCGCGKVSFFGYYLKGHNIRVNPSACSPEAIRKRSRTNTGVALLSRPPREKLYNEYVALGQSANYLGTVYGVCDGTIKRWLDYYGIATRSLFEACNTPIAREFQSENNRQRWDNLPREEQNKLREAISLSHIDYWDNLSEEEYSKRCEMRSRVTKRQWKDSSFKERMERILMRANHVRPTTLEQLMKDIIKDFNLPFRYNGSDAETIVGGLCPDFVSTNGVKMVILVDGIYWHQDPVRESKIDKTYKDNGYKVLHFADEELYNTDEVHIVTMINLELGGH